MKAFAETLGVLWFFGGSVCWLFVLADTSEPEPQKPTNPLKAF